MSSDNSSEITDALYVNPLGFKGIIGVSRQDISLLSVFMHVNGEPYYMTLQKGFTAPFVLLLSQ